MDEKAEIVLEGGPESIPRFMTVDLLKIREGKVKIEWRGGYEHFECADTIVAESAEQPVSFRWTMRTRIAE